MKADGEIGKPFLLAKISTNYMVHCTAYTVYIVHAQCHVCTFANIIYVHVGSRKSAANVDSNVVKSPHRVKLEPVGVFWDIENCPVPLDKSAFALAAKMRRVFFEGKREAEFMCVCDVTKERKEVTDALHKAQV